MIQPYFKPDVNPNMPAFATFYNGYFQERSKMNMQMMDLMLKQASPEYLTNVINRTQKNIEELQKTRDKILQSSQKDKMDLIKLQTNLQFQANKINAGVARENQEMLQGVLIGGGKSGQGYQRRYNPERTADEQSNIESQKYTFERFMIDDKNYKNNPTKFLQDTNLRPQDTPDVHKVALALEVLTENKEQIQKSMGPNFEPNVRATLERMLGGKEPSTVLANKYPYARGSIAPTTVSTPTTSEKKVEELGFMLTDAEQRFGDVYITKDGGKLSIRENIGDKKPKYSELNDETKDIIQKRLKQRMLQEKKGYVGAPKVKMPSQQDLQSTLDYIDKQLAEESEKLQGYLTRYDVGQQDILEKVFAPFESNYRTENLFKRKSPEVLQQEEEIRKMQYASREDTPTGYENIKYNTEYQAPGGLNFGITRVGEEEIPYIFEGDKPYEIEKSDPSYSFILDLLKEQDRKLGVK